MKNKKSKLYPIYNTNWVKNHDLIWFALASWDYLQGQRWEFFKGFIPSYRRFKAMGGTKS